MTKQLLINGTKSINGKSVKIIKGGFGENQKCMLASDIATQHDTEIKHLNELINKNISRFTINDIKDFCDEEFKVVATDLGLITSNRQKNCYIFSERGYIKLVSMMSNTNDTKWDVMDSLINDYFAMKEVIEQISEKDRLLLGLFSNDKMIVAQSHKRLVQIEVSEATKELTEKIENDRPVVEFGNQILKSTDSILIRELAKIISDEITKIGQNRLYEKLREWKMIMKGKTEPYQSYIENGYFELDEKSINTPYGIKITKTCKCTPRGQVAIVERFRKEMVSK